LSLPGKGHGGGTATIEEPEGLTFAGFGGGRKRGKKAINARQGGSEENHGAPATATPRKKGKGGKSDSLLGSQKWETEKNQHLRGLQR